MTTRSDRIGEGKMNKPALRTSMESPLRVDAVTGVGGGVIGMTLCPGKKTTVGLTGGWNRDLDLDLRVVRDFGALVVVSLLEEPEFAALGVTEFGSRVLALGMVWRHLPIRDTEAPGLSFAQGWSRVGPELQGLLVAGGRIVLHCRGGLGRTGTVAATILIEQGVDPEEAMALVRAARPGAIDPDQERYLRSGGVVARHRWPSC